MDFKHVDVWTKFMWLSTGSVASCYAPGNESHEFHKGWGFFDSPSDHCLILKKLIFFFGGFPISFLVKYMLK